jgi:hypothetical protein
MNNQVLEKLWCEIVYEPPSHYVYRRIDTICFSEMNVGLNQKINRCLILELPKVHTVDFQSINRMNLALYFFKDTNCIVLELLDKNFNDLFNDLTLSLYQIIKDIRDVSEYSAIFIQTFHKWSEFFIDKKVDRLSDEVIKGLFGELHILKSLAKASPSWKINDTLKSWQGPYDKGHDFIFEDKNIEVKTKNLTGQTIRISSEYQLEQELGKELELVVISVVLDPVNGASLRELAELIKVLVITRMGDVTILIDALNQKNLTFKNMHEYDNYRYVIVKEDVYDPTMIDFPKLIKSKLPDSINGVKYNLNLSFLDTFLIKTGCQ